MLLPQEAAYMAFSSAYCMAMGPMMSTGDTEEERAEYSYARLKNRSVRIRLLQLSTEHE